MNLRNGLRFGHAYTPFWGCRPKPRLRDIVPQTPFFASRAHKHLRNKLPQPAFGASPRKRGLSQRRFPR